MLMIDNTDSNMRFIDDWEPYAKDNHANQWPSETAIRMFIKAVIIIRYVI